MLTSNCSFLGELQEPFRWIADVAVMDAFESGVLDLPNFYFTGDDYRYRLQSEAKQRFLDLLRERFNSAVGYRGRALKWDTVIEQKADELGRFLIGKSSAPDFAEPVPTLERYDDREIRADILALTSPQAKQVGIAKSTLHYLRNDARKRRPLRVYSKALAKLGGVPLGRVS